MTTTAWTRVAGTGHRELVDGDPAWVAEQLPKAAAWLRDTARCRYAICGMARGFDLDWGEAALGAGLALCIAIPFAEQPARWSRADQTRWEKLRSAATRERIVGAIPADLPKERRSAHVNRLLWDRNIAMLDPADAAITVWEPGRLDGGTAGALLEAAKRRLPGVHLDPIGRVVNFRLPTADELQRYTLHRVGCGHVAIVGTRALVQERHDALAAAGRPNWRVRRSRPRETWEEGCDDCFDDLVAAATANLPV